MGEEYDFSNSRKNPYAKRAKRQITIEYFKSKADVMGIPYQTLINLYLADCVQKKREPQFIWK